MLRINEIKMPIGAAFEEVKKAAADRIGISEDAIEKAYLTRESVDSRKKNDIHMVYSIDLQLSEQDEDRIAARFEAPTVVRHKAYEYHLPESKRTSLLRPVVVGFGPAGMLCALKLCRAGLRPIVLERGNDVETRKKDVSAFWTSHRLNTESNVQFGEGGAGTFSDGKLTTGIKDARVHEVFLELAAHGAPEEILYSARPHIGTDRLPTVVRNIREDVIRSGGEVRFGCKLSALIVANGVIHGVTYTEQNGRSVDLETDCVVLCCGHSARDTVQMLYRKGVRMEKKAFSVGTRIEHPQEWINRAQYGALYDHPALGAADYKLSDHPPNGRGAYTFCMCPGGTVVCASSEEGGVVVNGMSAFARDGENANSAILIGIEPDHFDSEDLFSGMRLQREIERSAFAVGGSDYTAPAQLVGDFLKGRASGKPGAVRPTCPTGVSYTDIRRVLPDYITDRLGKAIRVFDRKLRGFALPDAVLTFPETRSSSPVRILRDEYFQSNIRGLFPCGEGAGYAGGIVSAGVDGIRCAEAVLKDET